MDLVDEEDGASPIAPSPVLGLAQNLAQLLDAGEDGGERLEVVLRAQADHVGERRLARSRRSPEDQGREVVGFQGAPQGTSLSERLLLAEELREGARAHTVREGSI